MREILKTICLILITIALLVGVGFYVWSTWEEQAYFQRQEARERADTSGLPSLKFNLPSF